MGDPAAATPQQIALGAAIVSLKATIAALDAYLAANANNLDDPKPIRDAVDALDAARDDLALSEIIIGLDVAQEDLDKLKLVSAELKQRLDAIDNAVAQAGRVFAIADAAVSLVNAVLKKVDPAALKDALVKAGKALKPA